MPDDRLLEHHHYLDACQCAARRRDGEDEMSEWQPIDTAPKDGSHFLAGDFSRRGFGYFNGKGVSWQDVVHWWGYHSEEGFYASSSNGDLRLDFLTHWMPLPEAPK